LLRMGRRVRSRRVLDGCGELVGGRSVLFIAATFWGSSWYRCHTPGMELKRRGYDVVLSDRPTEQQVREADVIVFERIWWPEAVQMAESVRARGGRAVFDLDDDYWAIPKMNPAHESWNVERLRDMVAVMRACDLATAPTKTLAERVGTFVDRVRVLPNMLPGEHWPEQPPSHHVGNGRPLVVGWAGSAGHVADFSVVRGVATHLLERYPEVELHLLGAGKGWIEPHPRIRLIDTVPIERYPQALEGFDIGIAQIEDNRFNCSKSDLKFVEYGMIGLPVVASKVGPYVECIKHRENGLLASSSKDWLKSLSALVSDAELRDSLGRASRAYAEKRLIADNVQRWERAYGLTD
jgi:hypothetical protein